MPNNRYLSKYAKRDDHFLRVSDTRYYFEDNKPHYGLALMLVLVLVGVIFLLLSL